MPSCLFALVTVVVCALHSTSALRTHAAQDPELPIDGVHEIAYTTHIDKYGAVNVSSLSPEKSAPNTTMILVEFYTSWCFWCRQFTPVFSLLSQSVDGMNSTNPLIVLAKMNLEEMEATPVKIHYDIMFFPTIVLILPSGVSHAFPEEEERSVENLVKFVMEHSGVKIVVPQPAPHIVAHSPGAVLRLDTTQSFEHVIYDVKKDVVVFFTAPWCSMCEVLSPMWEGLADSQSTIADVIVAEVDIESLPAIGEHFNIQSLPTIIAFPKRDKAGKQVYQGDDDVPSIEQWLLRVTK